MQNTVNERVVGRRRAATILAAVLDNGTPFPANSMEVIARVGSSFWNRPTFDSSKSQNKRSETTHLRWVVVDREIKEEEIVDDHLVAPPVGF